MNQRLAQARIPARMAAVLGGYVLYRWLGDDRIVPGLFVGGGAVLLAWAAIDELTLPRRDRPGLLIVGPAILGLGLLGLGLYLTFR